MSVSPQGLSLSLLNSPKKPLFLKEGMGCHGGYLESFSVDHQEISQSEKLILSPYSM